VQYRGGDQLNGRLGLCAAQVKVRVCWLGLLLPRLNGSPVCDDSATEDDMRKCNTILSKGKIYQLLDHGCGTALRFNLRQSDLTLRQFRRALKTYLFG